MSSSLWLEATHIFTSSKKRDKTVRQSTGSHCQRSSFTVDAIVYNKTCRLLIDTGADVSLLPPAFKSKVAPSFIKLTAANGTNIKVYGGLSTIITFPQLRRSFEMDFIVADVNEPILGSDFFVKHSLLIDVNHRHLIDQETKFSVNIITSSSVTSQIKLIVAPSDNISKVLAQNSIVFDITAS